jgi:hypothetical protein
VTGDGALGEEGSSDALLDALSRHQEFELFVARACSTQRDVAGLLSSAVAENERYADTIDRFGSVVGALVKGTRHPSTTPSGALRTLTDLLDDQGLTTRRAFGTDGAAFTATLHLSCDLFDAPPTTAPPRRPPARLFAALQDHRTAAVLSPYDGQRLEEARRIVVLRSAPYLTVPGGEYVLLQRLTALEEPTAPDRRLGLPRWALRALFSVGSTVQVEIEGTVLVVSLVLRADTEE